MQYTERSYHFWEFEACPVCGAGASHWKSLGFRLDRSTGFRLKFPAAKAVQVNRCRSCETVFPNPLPVPQAITDHYGVPAEDYWKPSYFNVQEDYMRAIIAQAKRYLAADPARPQPWTALDVGAGIGKAVVAFNRAGFDAYGLEPSPQFRAKALEKMGIAEDRLIESTAEAAPFEAEMFDFVNLAAVLEHVMDPVLVLRRCIAWLKPGGVLFVDVPSSYWFMARLMRRYYGLRGRRWTVNLSPMHKPYHVYEFAKKSFEVMLKDQPATVLHATYCANVSYAPVPIRALLAAWMARTGTGMQLDLWVQKQHP